MRAELLQLAAQLASRREPFVLAMVVRRQPYSSAPQPVVKREAARALADGQPRLLSLSPQPGADDRPGVTVLPMVCQSGGTVDVYLEPFLPPPLLLLFGLSPVQYMAGMVGPVWLVVAGLGFAFGDRASRARVTA